MNNLLTRALTGIVYVALTVSGILFNSYTFLCLFSVLTVLCLWEFYGLLNRERQMRINRWHNCFGGLLLFGSAYLYAAGIFPLAIFSLYLLYIVSVLVAALYEKRQDPITSVASVLLGQLYIALPFSLLNSIPFYALAGSTLYCPLLVLALFVFIWVNDTGAYIVGSRFGKHRLFERISPKKSWEGFAGGMLFTAVSSLVFARFYPEIPWYHWVGLSLVVVIFGTWGDLVESLIKRTLQVKDSGKVLPGHGGFLDRFDSLLLAVYAVFFYVQLFIQN